jgi:hypothetical protein
MSRWAGRRPRRETRKRRGKARVLALVVTATAMVLAHASPAGAHYVYRKSLLFHNSDWCLGSRAEVSHGGGGGYFKADSYSWRPAWIYFSDPLPCPVQTADNPKAPGYMATGFQVMLWDGNSWDLCTHSGGTQGGWWYNQQTTHHWSIYANAGSRTVCGVGSYQTISHSAVHNGEWAHGSLWSGSHSLGHK